MYKVKVGKKERKRGKDKIGLDKPNFTTTVVGMCQNFEFNLFTKLIHKIIVIIKMKVLKAIIR